ncbi:MAG TPA: cytochrome c [Thermoanaerobaculia bacterium]|nr:cytochrome c [Thermoanaerobaculia bacterium]
MYRGDDGKRRDRRAACAARLVALTIILLGAACRPPQEMADQPRYDPYEPSRFFEDGMSARPLVPGTIARGMMRDDTFLYEGKLGGELVDAFPFVPDGAVLARGRDRYDIYCSMCHGRSGYGDGMIVRRGFRAPSSFHVDRLRGERVGHFFDVITNGFGAMPPYRTMIPVEDRWAIVAYIRVLQHSQNVPLHEIPPEARADLQLEEVR